MFYTDTINHNFYGKSKHCDEQQHLTKQFTIFHKNKTFKFSGE